MVVCCSPFRACFSNPGIQKKRTEPSQSSPPSKTFEAQPSLLCPTYVSVCTRTPTLCLVSPRPLLLLKLPVLETLNTGNGKQKQKTRLSIRYTASSPHQTGSCSVPGEPTIKANAQQANKCVSWVCSSVVVVVPGRAPENQQLDRGFLRGCFRCPHASSPFRLLPLAYDFQLAGWDIHLFWPPCSVRIPSTPYQYSS